MRFSIEQRHLADPSGRPIRDHQNVAFFSCDAESADDAIRGFIEEHQAELIGSVLQFPGFQAIATMRNAGGVFTLQIAPASQQFTVG